MRLPNAGPPVYIRQKSHDHSNHGSVTDFRISSSRWPSGGPAEAPSLHPRVQQTDVLSHQLGVLSQPPEHCGLSCQPQKPTCRICFIPRRKIRQRLRTDHQLRNEILSLDFLARRAEGRECLKDQERACSDGSAVQSPGCSCRRLRFDQ